MVKAIVPHGLSAVRVYSTSRLLCIVLSITWLKAILWALRHIITTSFIHFYSPKSKVLITVQSDTIIDNTSRIWWILGHTNEKRHAFKTIIKRWCLYISVWCVVILSEQLNYTNKSTPLSNDIGLVRKALEISLSGYSSRCVLSLSSILRVALAPMLSQTPNNCIMTTTTKTTQLNKLPLSTIIFRTTDNTNAFLITTQLLFKKYNTWFNTYPSWRHQMKPWFSTVVFILHMLFLKHKCKVRSSLCFLLLRCSDNTCILLYISWKTWRRLGCLLHGSNDTTSCFSMIQQLSHNWHTSWRWRISFSPIWIKICECYAILYLQRE